MPRMFNPPHPGEVLREFLPENMWQASRKARLQVTPSKKAA